MQPIIAELTIGSVEKKSLDSLRNEAEEWKMVEWSLRIPDETRERSKKYCSNRTMGNTT